MPLDARLCLHRGPRCRAERPLPAPCGDTVLEHALGDAGCGPRRARVVLRRGIGRAAALVSVIDRNPPVLFIDTEMLFAETLAYQREVAGQAGPDRYAHDQRRPARPCARDPDGTLHRFNPDACCALRKTEPLERALAGFDGWITGRKRYQGASRAELEFFEAEGDLRIKVNPLAHWGRDDIQDYIVEQPPATPSAGGQGLSLDRLRALHQPGEAGRGRTRRALARHRQGRMRHSFRQRARGARAAQHRRTPHERDRHRRRLRHRRLDPRVFDAGRARRRTGGVCARPCKHRRSGAPVQPAGRHRADPHRLSRPSATAVASRWHAGCARWAIPAGCARVGPVIADQYAMARRTGFDEVEIPDELAARQTPRPVGVPRRTGAPMTISRACAPEFPLSQPLSTSRIAKATLS